ncbi:MAG: pilus assembly protein TadG-related protein [Planctomycetota bacterium]
MKHAFSTQSNNLPKPSHGDTRRGFAVIWILGCMPIFLAAVAFVVSVGRLDIARTELKTAAESAALAGARTWGQSPDDAAGQAAAMVQITVMIAANTVLGNTPTVVSIETGAYVGGVFTPSVAVPTQTQRAYRITLSTIVTGKLGASDYTVKSQALAVFNGTRAVLTYDSLNPSAS